MHALLVSTYELGRQPFGLASPAAWFRAIGWTVACVDTAKERLPNEAIDRADLVGFHLPMHTATRLAGPLIAKTRAINPRARICAYGLYAPLNADWLSSLGVDEVFGGEFEEELTQFARTGRAEAGTSRAGRASRSAGMSDRAGTSSAEGVSHRVAPSPGGRASRPSGPVPRLKFLVPDRSGLPSIDRYATLQLAGGQRKLVGYTEASRGCRHLCRHCPVVPVYDGQFRIVQSEVVVADIDAQVSAGAQHITFGDPDFFNGPTHSMRIVDALHRLHPSVTYDATIKVEHLLRHRDLLGRLVETGCAFVTTAVESIDDRVLKILEKGHTRDDFVRVVSLCRAEGLVLAPTFVAFHPWLTLDGYCDLLEVIEELDLVDHVAPIQLAIRLLIPNGSRLMELDEVRTLTSGFDPTTLTYRWSHANPALDELHQAVSAIVGVRLADDRRAVFDEISTLAHARAGRARPARTANATRAAVPYLSEPWYCCAEPNPDQVNLV